MTSSIVSYGSRIVAGLALMLLITEAASLKSEVELTGLANRHGDCVVDGRDKIAVTGTLVLGGAATTGITVELNSSAGLICVITDLAHCPPNEPSPCHCSNRQGDVYHLVMNVTADIEHSDRLLTLTASKSQLTPERASKRKLRYPFVSDNNITEVLKIDDLNVWPVRNGTLTMQVSYINFTVSGLSTTFTLAYKIDSSSWVETTNESHVTINVVSGVDDGVLIKYKELQHCRRSNFLSLTRIDGYAPSARLMVPPRKKLSDTTKKKIKCQLSSGCDWSLWYTAVPLVVPFLECYLFILSLVFGRCCKSRPHAMAVILILLTLLYFVEVTTVFYNVSQAGRCGLTLCHYVLITLAIVSTFIVAFFIVRTYFKDEVHSLLVRPKSFLMAFGGLVVIIAVTMGTLSVIFIEVLRTAIHSSLVLLGAAVLCVCFMGVLWGGMFHRPAEPDAAINEEYITEEYENIELEVQLEEEEPYVRPPRDPRFKSTQL